jgi:pimeloyl-ACP methyl ester carboxylesterase
LRHARTFAGKAPARRIKPDHSALPTLENTGMATDYYLDNIDLKNGAKPLTAVCVPNGFKAGEKANIILFLHGTGQTSIRDYFQQTDHDLRASLDGPSPVKQVILIAPTLSKGAQGGNLGGDEADTIPSNALQWYLPLVSAELKKQKPNPPIPEFDDPAKIGKIVLAAHSGGGKVMLALARTRGADKYADKIVECWGFDCLYGHASGPRSTPTPAPNLKAPQPQWAAWESAQKAHRETLWANWLRDSRVEFYLYCASGPRGGGTAIRSTNLDKLAKRRNLTKVRVVFDSSATHDGIIKPRFEERLQTLSL